jgi:hypothetical protein
LESQRSFYNEGICLKKKKLSACRGEGSVVGLQLRVRFVPAAQLNNEGMRL